MEAITPWRSGHGNIVLAGLGEQALLAEPMAAFFASRQCPAPAIRAAMDWALLQVKTRQVVIGGFHSPLEQSVLQVLLHARSPVVAVLARPVIGAKLSPDWLAAIAGGYMTVVSPSTKTQRDSGCCSHHRMHQPRVGIGPDMSLHPKVPLIAFFDLACVS